MPQLPKGPRASPVLSLRFVSDPMGTIARCARRYGDPFTLPSPGGALVTTGDPEGIRAIFSASPDNFVPFNRDDLGPVLGERSLFVQSGAAHKAARRLLMPPFHGARMRAYGEAIRAITLQWSGRLREGAPFVMEEATHEISLDVIIRAIFGITDRECATRFRDAFLEFSRPRPLLLFHSMRRRFGGRGPWAAALRQRDGVHALIEEEIQRRRAQGPGEDILSLMIGARDEDGSPIGDQELREQLLTLVVAGHETTGTSLAWAFYWLHRRPEALGRLRDEISRLGEEPSPEAIAALPFLDAVCAETMRLFPLIPLVTRRLAQPFRLKGYELPAGMGVAAAASLVHYDPAVYPEPSRFVPERFLERSYSSFEYIPFGGGARRCLGAAFALYEMKIVLATALGQLLLRLVRDAPVKARFRSVTLSPAGGIPMILEARTRTRPTRGGPRYALFTAIPFVGHLNPLLRQAEALARRGWRCAVATMSEARPHIEGKARGVDFVDLGPLGPLAQQLRQIEEEVSREPDFTKGTWRIMRSLNAQWAPMYDGLLAALRRDRPDVMIVDFASAAGIDAGETEGVPVILNNADLLPGISVRLLPPADHVPRLFSGMSIKAIGPGQRAVSAALRVVAPHLVALTLGRELNAVRATRGLPPVDVNLWHRDRLILVDGAFGLEYSRPLPPYVHMVGPMLPEEIEPLPDEDQRWLEQGPPVVYVNLGTLAMAPREQLAKMVAAFGGEEHRVLWVLRKPQHALLPEPLPGNLRVIEWGPPPISILSHPNVRVFVSHCGINSVHESLSAGTPIVGIPMLADQRDMGARVEDAGVGLCLDKTRFTAAELRRAISRVMHEGSFRSAIPAIQASFRRAGGVSRAADLIEGYAAERAARR